MRAMDTMWLALFGVALAAGQLLFKLAAVALTGHSRQSVLAAALTTPALWAALALYAAATALWVWILTRVPLSQAYPFAALGTVLVPLASVVLLGERVTATFWCGAALVVGGLLLTQRGVN